MKKSLSSFLCLLLRKIGTWTICTVYNELSDKKFLRGGVSVSAVLSGAPWTFPPVPFFFFLWLLVSALTMDGRGGQSPALSAAFV